MNEPKFGLTRQQKIYRGLVFVAAGIFIIIQIGFGDSAGPLLVWISWFAAAVAFGAMLAFIWSMRQHQ
ncbi:MAG: hypothetical protein Kow0031_16010 [Anaerolineae bacterium]